LLFADVSDSKAIKKRTEERTLDLGEEMIEGRKQLGYYYWILPIIKG
jgi:hypothetical protein